MSDQYTVRNTGMEVNPHITEAARRAVRNNKIEDETILEVPEYRGIFVAKSGHSALQTLAIIEEEEVRYVVGPKRA